MNAKPVFSRNEEECMRRVIYALVVVAVSVSVLGAPREGREGFGSRDRMTPMVRAVKGFIRAFGDGLTIPGSRPAPNPAPNP